MLVGQLPAHEGGTITALALTVHDGHALLASAGYDNVVRIWDVDDRRELAELRGHAKHPTGLAWTAGQGAIPSLISASVDGTMRWWDLETQKAIHIVTNNRWEIDALAVVAGPKDECLLAGEVGGWIKLWDPVTRSEVGVLGPAGSVQSLATYKYPDGRSLLASKAEYGTIRFWDVLGQQEIGKVQRSMWEEHPLALLELGTRVVFATAIESPGLSNPIGLYDLDGTRVAILEGHTKRLDVLHALHLPDGRAVLASAAADSTVRLWDLSNPERLEATSNYLHGGVHVAVFDDAEQGAIVIVGGRDGALYYHDMATGAVRMAHQAHDDRIAVVALRIDHNGRQMLVTADSGTDVMRFWNPATGEPVGAYQGHGPEFALITDDEERHVLVTSGSTSFPSPLILHFTDMDTRREWNVGFRDRGSYLTALASTTILNGDAVLAVGDHGGMIWVWNVTAGPLMFKVAIPVIYYGVHELSFLGLSDGRTWLIATSDAIYIWDLSTGQRVHTLAGHTGHLTCHDTTRLPDGRPILITGSPDGTARVWDPIAGRGLLTIQLDDPVMNCAALGTRVAVSTAHGLSVLDIRTSLSPAEDKPITCREGGWRTEAAAESFQLAAETGDPRGMASLAALLQRRGEISAAEHWLSRAADSGDPEAAFLLGDSHYYQHDLAAAESWWRVAAERGSVYAARCLAIMLSNHGQTTDAEEYARITADSFYIDGWHLLGWLAGIQGDHAAEERWYRRAARGNAESACRLGVLLQARGELGEAENCFTRAADDDHPGASARLKLAELHRRRRDAAGATALQRRAAAGDPASMYALALQADSASEWHTWMLVAAAADHPPAMRALGERYLDEGDHRKARYWLEAAAERYGTRRQGPGLDR